MRSLFFALFSAALLDCVGDPPLGGDAGKMTGEEGGPCFNDFTCKSGLVCNLGPNTCARPGMEAGADAAMDSTSQEGGGDAGTDAAPDAAPPCSGTQSGAVAWWPGNDNTIDVIGFASFAWGQPAYKPGKFANGFSFLSTMGTNIPIASMFKGVSGVNKMALELWFSMPNATTEQTLMACTANSFRLFVLNGNVNFVMGGNAVSTGAISTSSFNHLVVNYSGSTLQVYLNNTPGTPVSTNMTAVPGCGMDLRLGASIGAAFPFTGTIDEVAFYNRTLSTGEINTLFTAQQPLCRTP